MYCSNERVKENGVAIDMYRSPAVREMVEMYKRKKRKNDPRWINVAMAMMGHGCANRTLERRAGCKSKKKKKGKS